MTQEKLLRIFTIKVNIIWQCTTVWWDICCVTRCFHISMFLPPLLLTHSTNCPSMTPCWPKKCQLFSRATISQIYLSGIFHSGKRWGEREVESVKLITSSGEFRFTLHLLSVPCYWCEYLPEHANNPSWQSIPSPKSLYIELLALLCTPHIVTL